MANLELRNLVKRFGEVTVVSELNLSVQAGEFVVLLGESGCGKSTTLRMVAGLEEVTQGQIIIGGKDVTNAHPMARDIAMVFQNYALYPHMDVAQNLSFALRLAGRPQSDIDAKVASAAKTLNIEHLLKHRRPGRICGRRRDIATTVHRTGVHDHRTERKGGQPRIVESPHARVLALVGEEGIAHALELNSQHHQRIWGGCDRGVEVVFDPHRPRRNILRHEGRRGHQRDLGAERVEQPHVRSRDPRVQHVADDRHGDAVEVAAAAGSAVQALADRERVEQRLGGVLVGAVAGIDHRGIDPLRSLKCST